MTIAFKGLPIRGALRAAARSWRVVLALGAVCGALGAASRAHAQQAPDAGAPTVAVTTVGVATPPAVPDAPLVVVVETPPAGGAVPEGYASVPPPPPGNYAPAAPQIYGQPGYVAPVVEPTPENIRVDDANADHVVLGPTAFTAPRGSIYVSDYELLWVQGGVAVTDDLQLTLTSMVPVAGDLFYFADVAAKYAFLKLPRFHMAGIGSLLVIGDFGSGGSSLVVGRLGAAATACITENCYVHASASALFWLSRELSTVFPITLNLGLVARVAGVFSLLLEGDLLAVAGDIGASSLDFFEETFTVGYGVRFSGSNFGFDLTMVKPIFLDSSSDGWRFGYPFLSLTYRTDPTF